MDGWIDGRCRLNDRGKKKKEEKKEEERKRNDRLALIPRSRKFFGWKKFLKERERKKQVELIRLFASRETFRE